MIHTLTVFGTLYKEHRLIFFAGGMANVPRPGTAALDRQAYLEWKRDTAGADAMFNYFDEKIDVTLVDLFQYIQTLKSSQISLHTLFEDELLNAVYKMNSGSSDKEKVEGEQQLLKVVELINKRSEVLAASQMARVQLNEGEILPKRTGQILEVGKSVLGTTVDAFKSATGQEKVLMLAGVATGLMLVRFGMRTFSDLLPGTSSWARKLMGFTIGTGVTFMALEVLNKTIVKRTGNSIQDKYARLGKSPQELEDMDQAKALDKAYSEIAGQRISVKFIDGLHIPDENKEYILGIDALSDLSVEQFLKLYDNHKADQLIPENDTIYPLGSDEDLLTPVKRFLLVREIGQTLGIIDSNNKNIPPTTERELQQPLMRRIIDEPKFLD